MINFSFETLLHCNCAFCKRTFTLSQDKIPMRIVCPFCGVAHTEFTPMRPLK